MIDTFSLFLSHGLLLIAFWRLSRRPELDAEDAERPSFRRPTAPPPAPSAER